MKVLKAFLKERAKDPKFWGTVIGWAVAIPLYVVTGIMLVTVTPLWAAVVWIWVGLFILKSVISGLPPFLGIDKDAFK